MFSLGQYPTIFADEMLFKVWRGDLTERNLYDTPSRTWYRVLREVGGRVSEQVLGRAFRMARYRRTALWGLGWRA